MSHSFLWDLLVKNPQAPHPGPSEEGHTFIIACDFPWTKGASFVTYHKQRSRKEIMSTAMSGCPTRQAQPCHMAPFSKNSETSLLTLKKGLAGSDGFP